MDSSTSNQDGSPASDATAPVIPNSWDFRDIDLVHRDIRLPRTLDKQLAAIASQQQMSTGDLIVSMLRDAASSHQHLR